MQNIFKRLQKEFTPKLARNYIQLNIPVITFTNGGYLELRIKQKKDSYTIYCPTNLFLEANAGGDQEYYFNLYNKNEKNIYNVKIKKGKIYKDYQNDFNVVIAVNEFIRFYVAFDDFIINNDVIGHEEAFE